MDAESKTFAPWIKDQRQAMLSGTVGAGLLGMAALPFIQPQLPPAWIIGFGLAGVVAVAHSARLFRRSKSRAFGKFLESRYIPRAIGELSRHGLHAKANVMVNGLGDVDMVVMGNSYQAVVVEIKSFRRWGQFFFIPGKRERQAIQQVRRQQAALRAYQAVIWLPQGQPTLFQRLLGPSSGGVRIVFGREDKLAKELISLLKQ